MDDLESGDFKYGIRNHNILVIKEVGNIENRVEPEGELDSKRHGSISKHGRVLNVNDE